jgi:hypothetical protein
MARYSTPARIAEDVEVEVRAGELTTVPLRLTPRR